MFYTKSMSTKAVGESLNMRSYAAYIKAHSTVIRLYVM